MLIFPILSRRTLHSGIISTSMSQPIKGNRSFPGRQRLKVMGESRVIVEELLTLCLQRITMEESTISTELGETPWDALGRPGDAPGASDATEVRSSWTEVLQS